MILFIASEVMFFVAWFWAFFSSSLFPAPVEWVDGAVQHITDTAIAAQWPMKGIEVLDPFGFPLLNTFILLCSGTTVTWAHHALIHGDREGLKKGLWCTILLGLLFTASRPTNISMRRSTLRATSTARPSSWRPASTVST